MAGLKSLDHILSVNEVDFTKLLIHEAIIFLKSVDLIKLRVKRPSISKTNKKIENSQSFACINLTRQNKKFHFGFKLNFVMEESKKNKLIVIR